MSTLIHRGDKTEANRPAGLDSYTIRLKPNWIARISTGSVLLLVLFFSVTQYQASNDAREAANTARTLLLTENKARIAADTDRRVATEALTQARAAQAAALIQNGQLVEVSLALEDQIARLGVKPAVPPNDVLRLKARTALPQPSAIPSAFRVPTPRGHR